MKDFWDFMGWLFDEAVYFMSSETICGFGLNFNLWEWALGSCIVSLLLYAIFRVLD